MVASLIKESSINFDEDAATNLLMGIEEGSDNLQGSSVTAETFLVISELMKAGGKRVSSQAVVQRKDFPNGSIPGSFPNPLVKPVISNQLPPAQTFSSQSQSMPVDKSEEKAPDEWLQPKIYKGSSSS